MRKKYQIACAVAVITLPVLAVMRVLSQPRVVSGVVEYGLDLMQLLLTAAALLFVVLIASGKGERYGVLSGGGATVVASGMTAAGVAMVISSLMALVGWLFDGVVPYPSKNDLTQTDELLLYLLVLTGVGGGVFLLLTGGRWFLARRTQRGIHRLAALLPVVWIWVRIARYEISYISSLSVFRSGYELLMLVLEMLFFLSLARYTSGIQKTMPRMLVGLSLATAMLAAMSWITRIAMLISRNEAAFDACGLGTSADLGIAVLGFLFAFAQAICEEESLREEGKTTAGPAEEDEEDDIGLLLTSEDLSMVAEAPEETEELRDFFSEKQGSRQPLELDDIISDIVSQHQGGEK